MEKHVLVEYLSTVESVIHKTFKSTQRLKVTSFDVSLSYIIFGVSSGGIYIFKRSPCQFLRIIPSKEGSTIHVCISPNEKHLAVASSKGLVIILEDYFVDMNLRPLIHMEHEGNTLTALKWHANDLYCGDDTGRISVFTLASLLTKAIFQTPSATLMQLDSTIIQLDAYKQYLLISTRTRTHLCDTDKEQFKQIGKKLRDGPFGACFFHNSSVTPNETYHSSRATFKTLKDGENFASNLNNGDIKIFCSRPGARIWQANFEASVLATYQFRDSLDQESSDIIVIEDSDTAKLKINRNNGAKISKKFNFGKIYLLCQKFIFTYDSEGMYFFEPTVSSVAFWSPALKDIEDIRILDSHIYVWCNGLCLHVISLTSLEDILISTLMKKQYYLCAELCLHFYEDVESMIHSSNRIHLLRHLESKVAEFEATSLLIKLKPIFNILEDQFIKQTSKIKLSNKMVSDGNSDIYLPKTVDNFSQSSLKTKNSICEKEDSEIENKYNSLHKQYLLNKTHKKAELTETNNIFNTINLTDLIALFDNFSKFIHNTYDENASGWCQDQLLKQAVKQGTYDLEEKTILYLTETLLTKNCTKDLCCECNFPLPKAHTQKIEHYDLACTLFDLSNEKTGFLNRVPQLHKYKLSKLSNLHEIILNLPILTQFSDKEVFKEHLDTLTYDSWEEVVKLYIKLRQKQCLNCSKVIDVESTMSWTDIGMLIVESIGSTNTNRLLTRYAAYIPNGELDAKFYQSSIFIATCEEPKVGMHFIETVVDNEYSKQFDELMEKFLQNKYLDDQPQTITKFNVNESSEVCSYCKLSLTGPILKDIKKCNNGHVFHSICFLHTSHFCVVCLSAS